MLQFWRHMVTDTRNIMRHENTKQTQDHAEEDDNKGNSEVRRHMGVLSLRLFLMELCKWWNAMQPVWHQNKISILPLPVYDHSLNKDLQKGDQNSIVTILIGLMWWGQSTLKAKNRKNRQNRWKYVMQPYSIQSRLSIFIDMGISRKGWGRTLLQVMRDGRDDEQGIC
ncbi:uncharacterized protein BT62DRAFT_923395 [Guyanagaster necrorhizus]|uniref:Uncharacterized protein n=1 Tax=Guyanagaster necrorhizus TaxID=856835 RepID=A0A9P7VIU0_9AGAR|nr:uncharacterized protein BT62DRAFT_923395 [Guyanagaster necrorhizus MCA 3950]KAG7441297.1 hypothetical protein BT62DRAFT_923395 [Guyanagaster necrorhizus MCA 3950]